MMMMMMVVVVVVVGVVVVMMMMMMMMMTVACRRGSCGPTRNLILLRFQSVVGLVHRAGDAEKFVKTFALESRDFFSPQSQQVGFMSYYF